MYHKKDFRTITCNNLECFDDIRFQIKLGICLMAYIYNLYIHLYWKLGKNFNWLQIKINISLGILLIYSKFFKECNNY